MDDSVANAVRRKRNSSIRVAGELVREGQAQALVSAGNTGAVMMTSVLVIGTLPKVDRPALATIFPNAHRARHRASRRRRQCRMQAQTPL